MDIPPSHHHHHQGLEACTYLCETSHRIRGNELFTNVTMSTFFQFVLMAEQNHVQCNSCNLVHHPTCLNASRFPVWIIRFTVLHMIIIKYYSLYCTAGYIQHCTTINHILTGSISTKRATLCNLHWQHYTRKETKRETETDRVRERNPDMT